MPTLREQYEIYCRDPDLLDAEAMEAVRLNEHHVDRDIRLHAETYLYWARLNAYAESELASVELHTNKFVFPNCCLQARAAFAAVNEKVAEARITESAMCDPAYQEQLSKLRNAEKIAATFKRIESAMWQRKDMLQSLNSRQCREMSVLPGQDLESLKENARRIVSKG